jgi:hypothetical protein
VGLPRGNPTNIFKEISTNGTLSCEVMTLGIKSMMKKRDLWSWIDYLEKRVATLNWEVSELKRKLEVHGIN